MPSFSNQFVVNGSLSNSQSSSHVATLFDGRSVVAYVDFGVNGATIKYKIFNADGTVSVVDTVANPDTTAPGVDPGSSAAGGSVGIATSGDYLSVTGLSNGGWVIAWQYRDTAGNENIYYRVFKPNGEGGAILRAHSGYSNGDQIEPDVTWTADGFAIIWSDSTNLGAGSADTIVVEHFDLKGGSVSIERVDTGSTGPGSPDIAFIDDRLLYAYTGNSPKGIFGGDTKEGNFRADNPTGSLTNAFFAGDPSVAYSQQPGGAINFLTVWIERATPGAARTIMGSINGKGDSVFQISASGIDTDDANPCVTPLIGGGWLVLWTDGGNDGIGGTDYDVIGQVISAGGAKVGGEFVVTDAATTFNSIDHVTVDTLMDGRVLVTWNGGGPGVSGNDTFARYIDTRTGPINVVGNGFNNHFIGTNWGDTIDGSSGNDRIDARGGDDKLIGGLGADTMIGGSGNDTYYVDNAADIVDESVSGSDGIDTVISSVTYDLSNTTRVKGAVERLTLTGTASINAIGNGLNNILIGNSGNNVLDGKGGNDQMRGLQGNDRYYIDSTGDVADESVSGSNGIDTIVSSITLSLYNAAQVKGTIERLGLTGTANINATGNALDNILTGNSGANVLNGSIGADSMRGLGGSDFYYVDNAGDIIDETVAGSNGTDTVYSSINFNLADTVHVLGSVERLTLLGTGPVNGTGNDLSNVIRGNSGTNVIAGGRGNDTLTGAGGTDYFLFNTTLNSSTNVDTITDFAGPSDTIQLDNAIFTALTATGFLSSAAFRVGAAAGDATDRIVYDSATGALLYDRDGTGTAAAIKFAQMSTGLALTNGDFHVV